MNVQLFVNTPDVCSHRAETKFQLVRDLFDQQSIGQQL
jgi:hypothetical protein